jgi:hypothetical protein
LKTFEDLKGSSPHPLRGGNQKEMKNGIEGNDKKAV